VLEVNALPVGLSACSSVFTPHAASAAVQVVRACRRARIARIVLPDDWQVRAHQGIDPKQLSNKELLAADLAALARAAKRHGIEVLTITERAKLTGMHRTLLIRRTSGPWAPNRSNVCMTPTYAVQYASRNKQLLVGASLQHKQIFVPTFVESLPAALVSRTGFVIRKPFDGFSSWGIRRFRSSGISAAGDSSHVWQPWIRSRCTELGGSKRQFDVRVLTLGGRAIGAVARVAPAPCSPLLAESILSWLTTLGELHALRRQSRSGAHEGVVLSADELARLRQAAECCAAWNAAAARGISETTARRRLSAYPKKYSEAVRTTGFLEQ